MPFHTYNRLSTNENLTLLFEVMKRGYQAAIVMFPYIIGLFLV